MDAFVGWFWGTGWFWVVVFWVGLVVNGRAVFKLLLDWRGMLTTWRFVDAAYRAGRSLPRRAPAVAAEAALAARDAGGGAKGPPAELGPPSRALADAPRGPGRPGARLGRRERRRLDPRPEHLPLDRRRRSS